MNEISQTNKARDLLALWVHKINLNSAIDFYDINKVAENLCANLLNEIYGYQLINLNDERRNFPAVDLGCDVKKIAFQITATKEADKVKEKIESTLDKFVNHKLQNCFTDGVWFLFLTTDKLVKLTDANKKKYQGIYSGFDEKYLLTLQDLIQEIQVLYNKDNKSFCKILEILERELSPQSSNYGVPQKALDRLNELLDKKDIELQKHDETIQDLIEKYNKLESQLTKRTDDIAKQAKELLDEGKLEEAENLFEEALENDLTIAKEANLKAAANYFSLAQIKSLRLDYHDTKKYYQQAVQLDPSNALYLNELGLALFYAGEYKEAKQFLNKGLAIREEYLCKNHTDIAESLLNLALVYFKEDALDIAESFFVKSLKIVKNGLDSEQWKTAIALRQLAQVYQIQEKYEKAQPLLEESLKILENVSEQHPSALATTLHDLAKLYTAQDEYAKAEGYFKPSLELNKKILGENHPHVATNLNGLAYCYFQQHKYEEAEPLYKQGLVIREKTLGKNHPDVAYSLSHLAMFYDDQGDYSVAEPLYIRSLAILENTFGKDHRNTKIVRGYLEALQAKKY